MAPELDTERLKVKLGVFWPGFRSGHRKGKNGVPEADSGLDPEMGTERIKVKLLRPILAWFQEWAQKG